MNIGEIFDLPKKSSQTGAASIISGPQLNIIASILEVLEILSEVIQMWSTGKDWKKGYAIKADHKHYDRWYWKKNRESLPIGMLFKNRLFWKLVILLETYMKWRQ